MYVGDKKQSDSGDLGYDLKVFPILTNGIDVYPAALGKTCNHCILLDFLHIITPQVLFYDVYFLKVLNIFLNFCRCLCLIQAFI